MRKAISYCVMRVWISRSPYCAYACAWRDTLLEQGVAKIGSIAQETGFDDQSHITCTFHVVTDLRPFG